ncbi:MAG: hypothetical protein LBL00_01230 [Endomicrobium sp.]|jgi:hypothetical protein|nr:hypothetical protein [Endomicrobium sp.]
MIKNRSQIEYDIKDTISKFKLTPYSKVKKNLDTVSRKTRKALGVSMKTIKKVNG